jgi:hypothetical protein
MWDWTPVAEYLYNWVRFNIFDAGKADPFTEQPKSEPVKAPIEVPAPDSDLPF